ncbi:negative transcriptional regulator [Microthyrium microscopicum]|uniref:Negative transcriptional regulator n=1 Tax=Microthyrium microscopicum TaxID=703497 RepID=A0A6A6TXQ4_9PEZI|nr:negative transcriptional regulator [Microthyrium microscopicum]
MYLRDVHAEASLPKLRQLIRKNPLGVLTTAISSKTFPKILSSHIPFLLDIQDEESETELGVLRCHLARMNPQSKTMIEEIESRSATTNAQFLEEEVLVLFTATAQHYVTPKFYKETKPTTGKVVPTWNYAATQVYGRAKIYFDAKSPETRDFLSKQISDLSQYVESSVMGYTGVDGKPSTWKVSDAPDRYIDLLQKSIIGMEIEIDRMEGKFKMSQELGEGDRKGVIQGFSDVGSDVGLQIAQLVKERGELKVAK